MPDLAAIGTILTSLKTAMDIAKGLREADLSLEKAEFKFKLAEMITALADARAETASVQEELLNKDRRIRELQESLDVQKSMKYAAPFYWLEDGERRDGPFCQQCFDSQRKLIRLQVSSDGDIWSCKTCGHGYSLSRHRSRQTRAATDFDPFNP